MQYATEGLPILGLVGVDDLDLFESLQNPIIKVARLEHARADQIVDPGFALDGAIVVIGKTPGESMKPVPTFRRAHPTKPIFVAGEGLAVDEAVELMLAGVTDVLALPVEAPTWKAKMAREFLGAEGPAKSTPVLKAFMADAPVLALPGARPFNRRLAQRADVPPQFGAKAQLTHHQGEGQADLIDFSIAMAGQPGAARVRCDAEAAANLKIASWTGSTALALALQLPGVDAAITGQAMVVPPIRQIGEDGAVSFGIQYTLDDLSHAGDARRFWSACCERVLRPTRPWVVPTV